MLHPTMFDPPPITKTRQRTRQGDLWRVGDHTLLVGSATVSVGQRLAAEHLGCTVVTDPPYSSGGWQAAGRVTSQGKQKKSNVNPIRGDLLSVAGWQALLREAIWPARPAAVYIFTDWRMWHHLFDVVEGMLGLRARSMIVWNKGTPGMGLGWRAQHELIMCAVEDTGTWPAGWGGMGNVIDCPRTGNVNHTTEKPLALMRCIVANNPHADTIFDPFAGSGTTMVAAHLCGKRAVGIEYTPSYADVALARLEYIVDTDAQLEE